jgi:hypothetical protein
VVLYGAALRVPLDWDGEQGRGARCHSGPNVGTVTAQGFGHERENVGGVRAIDALVCEATVAPSQGENLLVTGDLDDRRRTNYLERTAVTLRGKWRTFLFDTLFVAAEDSSGNSTFSHARQRSSEKSR